MTIFFRLYHFNVYLIIKNNNSPKKDWENTSLCHFYLYFIKKEVTAKLKVAIVPINIKFLESSSFLTNYYSSSDFYLQYCKKK